MIRSRILLPVPPWPVLYRTMVVTADNFKRVQALTKDPTFAHVCRAVRRLIIPGGLVDLVDDSEDVDWTDFARHFSGVLEVDIPFSLLLFFAALPEFHPQRVAVRYAEITRVGAAPSAAMRDVTHLQGYFPSEVSSPREWAQAILPSLPSLTHVALDLVDLQPDASDHDSDSEAEYYPETDPESLKDILDVLLEHSGIQCVALDIAGERTADWPVISSVLRGIADPRLHIWLDERSMIFWRDEEQMSVEDGWAGRDIWSEALPFDLER